MSQAVQKSWLLQVDEFNAQVRRMRQQWARAPWPADALGRWCKLCALCATYLGLIPRLFFGAGSRTPGAPLWEADGAVGWAWQHVLRALLPAGADGAGDSATRAQALHVLDGAMAITRLLNVTLEEGAMLVVPLILSLRPATSAPQNPEGMAEPGRDAA